MLQISEPFQPRHQHSTAAKPKEFEAWRYLNFYEFIWHELDESWDIDVFYEFLGLVMENGTENEEEYWNLAYLAFLEDISFNRLCEELGYTESQRATRRQAKGKSLEKFGSVIAFSHSA